MLPLAPAATALGPHKLHALTVLDGWVPSPVLKDALVPCPHTMLAVLELSGVKYPPTRWAPVTATNSSSVGSSATPLGAHKLVELGVTQLCVDDPVRPNSFAAAPPTHGNVLAQAANGALNSSTR